MSHATLPLLVTSVEHSWPPMSARNIRAFLASGGVCLAWLAPAPAAPVGSAQDALPGLYRVPMAETMPAAVSGALSIGYGMTEAQPGEAGAHHRTLVTGALGVAPTPRLQLSLRAEGRHDQHPEDSQGDNSGTVLSPTLAARWVEPLDSTFSLGAGASVWLPGSGSPLMTIEGASPSAIAFTTVRLPPFALTALGGYRLDRSHAASPDLASMRPGDRVALGLSDFDAALLALGVACSLGQVRLFAEATADILLGSGAPPVAESPLTGSAGARYALDAAWSLELLGSASFSERPGLSVGDPLVPIEPRLTALAGVRLVLPFEREGPAPEAPPPAPRAIPAPEPELVTLRVRVRLDLARPTTPIATLERAGESFVAARAGEQELEFRELPAGIATVRVRADGYHELAENVRVEPHMPPLDVELRAVRDAQLRGLVRSLQGGRGLRARVRVEPFGIQVETDAEGFFELDVPSGRYAVSVEAEGYQPQQRNIGVERDGVVILNMDLARRK